MPNDLEKLLDEMVTKEIGKHLFNFQKYRLARCGNKHLYSLFKEPASKLVCQFLLHVVNDERNLAEKMLKRDPGLLLEEGTVTDCSRRRVKGTAFRLAIAAENNDMWEMIENYFKLLSNGEEEKKKQFNAQFPNGVKDAPCAFDFTPLFNAIKHDKFDNYHPNDKTEKELKKFRDYFTPKASDVITTGKHFNMNALMKVFEYDQKFNLNLRDDRLQQSFFRSKVMDYLQQLIPAGYPSGYVSNLPSGSVRTLPLFGPGINMGAVEAECKINTAALGKLEARLFHPEGQFILGRSRSCQIV